MQTLCSSVEAYRHLEVGITQAGDKGLKSNVSQCIVYFNTTLKVAATIPFVNAFA